MSLGLLAMMPATALADRALVQLNPPSHDPFYIDTASIKRAGASVTFHYILDVMAAAEGRTTPGGWKSNEVEATIDCERNTISTGRLIAYAGPRASGAVTDRYTPILAEQKPDRIVANSTTAYLAAYVCGRK
jgi:hypothetical protein